MKRKENVTDILIENMDEEALSKMPEWLIILREAYKRKICQI